MRALSPPSKGLYKAGASPRRSMAPLTAGGPQQRGGERGRPPFVPLRGRAGRAPPPRRAARPDRGRPPPRFSAHLLGERLPKEPPAPSAGGSRLQLRQRNPLSGVTASLPHAELQVPPNRGNTGAKRPLRQHRPANNDPGPGRKVAEPPVPGSPAHTAPLCHFLKGYCHTEGSLSFHVPPGEWMRQDICQDTLPFACKSEVGDAGSPAAQAAPAPLPARLAALPPQVRGRRRETGPRGQQKAAINGKN